MNKNNRVVKMLNTMEFNFKFGRKGVYPVKGILQTVGTSSRGTWFSMLVCKKVTEKTNLGDAQSFIYVQKMFNLDGVQEESVKKQIAEIVA